jgi:glycosyltransferase involved in cell wall biosynthesis
MMVDVSVIIPVYNVDKYLDKCLESFVKIDDGISHEIIAVNDGSTDGSEALLQIWSTRLPNLRIINKRNGGLSDARNSGLQNACGEYVLFVDADDCVDSEMIGVLYNKAKQLKCDIVESAMVSFVFEGMHIHKYKTYDNKGAIATKGELLKNIHKVNSSVCNKLIRRSLFVNSGVKFPVGVVHEDMATLPIILASANGYSYVDCVTYHYRVQREGSITTASHKSRLQGQIAGLNFLRSEVQRLALVNNDTQEAWAWLLIKNFLYLNKNYIKSKCSMEDEVIGHYSDFAKMIGLPRSSLSKIHYKMIYFLLYSKHMRLLRIITTCWVRGVITKDAILKKYN